MPYLSTNYRLYPISGDKEVPSLDYRLQDNVNKLPIELKQQILQELLPEAIEDLAKIQKSQKLSHKDIADYNTALDHFQLVAQHGTTDIPAASNGETTILNESLNNKQTDITKQFLELPHYLTQIDQVNRSGFTPLSKAILSNQTLIANELIAKGADVRAKDLTGRTPMDWASLMGKPKLLDAMLKKAVDDISEKEKKNLKELALSQEAAAKRRMRSSLFDFGSIDSSLSAKEIQQKHDHIFKQGMAGLASGKINPHPKTNLASNLARYSIFEEAIMATSETEYPETLDAVHAIIQSGVDVNQHANALKLPLGLAVESRNMKTVEALLKAGADPNKKAHKGASVNQVDNPVDNPDFAALHYAASAGHLEMVKLLLAHKADPTLAVKRDNKTADQLAEDAGFPEIAQVIRDA